MSKYNYFSKLNSNSVRTLFIAVGDGGGVLSLELRENREWKKFYSTEVLYSSNEVPFIMGR